MTKIWLGFGSLVSMSIPLASVISCGANLSANKGVAFEKGDNKISFSLNSEVVTNDSSLFAPYFANGITYQALVKLNNDIHNAMTSNNVLKTKSGEYILANVSISFKTTIAKGEKGNENGLKDIQKSYKLIQEIKFKLANLSNDSELRKQPFKFTNNIVLSILKALARKGYISGLTSVSEKNLVGTISKKLELTKNNQFWKDLAQKIDSKQTIEKIEI